MWELGFKPCLGKNADLRKFWCCYWKAESLAGWLQQQHFDPETAREVAEPVPEPSTQEERGLPACQGVDAEKSRAPHRALVSFHWLLLEERSLSVPHSEMKPTPESDASIAGRTAGEQQHIKRREATVCGLGWFQGIAKALCRSSLDPSCYHAKYIKLPTE